MTAQQNTMRRRCRELCITTGNIPVCSRQRPQIVYALQWETLEERKNFSFPCIIIILSTHGENVADTVK